MAKRLFNLTLVIWLYVSVFHSTQAQVPILVNSSSEFKLPEFANWRFGERVSQDPNGFYVLNYCPNNLYIAARNRTNIVEIRRQKDRQVICQLSGHDAKIDWVEFSTDSKHLLTAASGEPVKIWSLPNGKQIATIDYQPIDVTITQQNEILVLEKEKLIRLSFPQGQLIDELTIQTNSNRNLAVSTDGRFVVAVQRVNNRRIYLTKFIDLKNDSTVIMRGPAHAPKRIVFSPDNQWAAAIYARRNEIHLWNLNNPGEINFRLNGHRKTVETISFSGDSRWLASAGWGERIFIWDLLTKKKVGELVGHENRVIASAWHPWEPTLMTGATGTKDNSALEWSVDQFFFKHVSQEDFDFETAWSSVANSDSRLAMDAIGVLRLYPEKTLRLLRDQFGNDIQSSDFVFKWIEELDSPFYLVRENATTELTNRRIYAERFLIDALDSASSTEVRFRISNILKTEVQRPAMNQADLYRIHRGIYLLELIGSVEDYRSECSALLKIISGNHAHIDVARQASSAVDRLNR